MFLTACAGPGGSTVNPPATATASARRSANPAGTVTFASLSDLFVAATRHVKALTANLNGGDYRRAAVDADALSVLAYQREGNPSFPNPVHARTESNAWRHAAEALRHADRATAEEWILLAKTAFGQDLMDTGWIWGNR